MTNRMRDTLVKEANSYLRSSNLDRGQRRLVASLVEKILMEAKCYRGFNYQYWKDQGYQEWVNAGQPEFPEKNYFLYGPSGDDSKIEFY